MAKKRSVSKEKPYRCTEEGCSSSFVRNSKLLVHLRKHTGERPFICEIENCNKTYTNSSHLRRHKNLSHNDNKPDQEILCEFEGCGLYLANKYALKKHYTRKHVVKDYPFKCAECMQGFYKKKHLQQHFYLHTGDPPFKCDKCTKSFVSNRDYSKHCRSHRTYKCDCTEIFYRWSDLLVHRKRCQRPKYVCLTCDKKFSHSSNFKNHSLTHQEQENRTVFQCPYRKCERIYFQKTSCMRHIREFHNKIFEKTFCCTYSTCTATFKRKQNFLAHYKRHFNWIEKNKIRKTRKDKGISKNSTATVLSGIKKLSEINCELLQKNQNVIVHEQSRKNKSIEAMKKIDKQRKNIDNVQKSIVSKNIILSKPSDDSTPINEVLQNVAFDDRDELLHECDKVLANLGQLIC